jgi:DNA-binding NtrC family response regulator
MPPLRERLEDIPLLAEFFIGRFAPKANRRVRGLSSAARACLSRYNWVGNVRELENAIERAVVMGTSDRILPEDLPEALLESAAGGDVESREGGGPEAGAIGSHYHDAIRRAKKDLILEALRNSNGSIVEAASALGLHPNYLHRLIRNLDLRPPAGRRAEK